MVFFPDNQKRATRLQQLVDSMANMQTDVKNIGQQMDDKNAKYRPTIDAMLTANGMDSVDDVINKASAEMTPDERKEFEALITTVKNTKSGFDTTYFIASLLMVPGGTILTAKMALAIVHFGSRMINVKDLANFFTAVDEGTEAAAQAADEIATEAKDAEQTLQDAGDAGDAGEEVAEAATMAGRIGTFFEVLGAVGLVVTLIAGIIEAIEGDEQKTKLIDAIHGLQPSRLTTAFFKQEGTNIMQQLESLQIYLDASPGGSNPNPAFATFVSQEIISQITQENAAIDLNKLETDLETQDRESGTFYGDDDLSHDDVVAAASKST